MSNCFTEIILYFIYYQSLSENDLGVVGAMVIDEVLNSNSWLTQLNLSGESPTNAKAEVTHMHITLHLMFSVISPTLYKRQNLEFRAAVKFLTEVVSLSKEFTVIKVQLKNVQLNSNVCARHYLAPDYKTVAE